MEPVLEPELAIAGRGTSFTGSQKRSRVEDVQAVHRGNDHCAIHDIEDQIYFVQMGLSLLHTPDIYHERSKRAPCRHILHVAVQHATARQGSFTTVPEWFVVPEPIEKLDRQDHVDCDCEHLENNATHHDSSTLLDIFMVPSSDRRKGPTDTLNAQRHEISSYKHNGICE